MAIDQPLVHPRVHLLQHVLQQHPPIVNQVDYLPQRNQAIGRQLVYLRQGSRPIVSQLECRHQTARQRGNRHQITQVGAVWVEEVEREWGAAVPGVVAAAEGDKYLAVLISKKTSIEKSLLQLQ